MSDTITPTTKAVRASIFTGDDGETTKYTIQTSWNDPTTGISLPTVFNINSDILVEKFKSVGAPAEETLVLEYRSDSSQPVGFQKFSGIIGGGRIYIQIDGGIVIKGDIMGGPEQGQTFVGAGTWTRA